MPDLSGRQIRHISWQGKKASPACGRAGSRLWGFSALRCPKNRSGLRCSSDSSTAAVIPQCLHLPPAAALRDSRRPIHCRSHRSRLYFKNRPNVFRTSDLFWQGKKASNPRPTVLETAALPAELFPCISFGGPSGTRTPDRPVMSRLLYQLS